jgi:transcription initiation factor IIE alpha subunit
MHYDYYCPLCKGHLRVNDNLVFIAKSKNNKKGMIFLSPELGNYTTSKHPDFHIEPGEEYLFYCPICHATLNREENNNLVKVFMVDEEGKEFEIFFSGIAGEKCTYKMRDRQVEGMGPDAELYKQYFDVPEEYKKYLEN